MNIFVASFDSEEVPHDESLVVNVWTLPTYYLFS